MQILRDPNFDFMKYRRLWLMISAATIIAGMIGVFFLDRLNFGVDFAGGTQLTLKFRDQPQLDELRRMTESLGFKEAVLQRFGQTGDNEVMIRTAIVEGSEEGSAKLLTTAMHERLNPGTAAGTDLNQIGSPTLSELLARLDPDGVGSSQAAAHYSGIAEAIMAERKSLGVFSSWDEVGRGAGVSPRLLEVLRNSTHLGEFAVLGVENVGPQVGSELRRQGLFAVAGAMVGMLLYIWVRFELRFGIGATMATIHDVLITLGIFAWAGYEFNLTTVAAFLTLIGYSVNDTVVTFDRVRENLRRSRSQSGVEVLNRSINQTLSRTILTGGTTITSSACLFIWGGDVIRGFAFVMMIGVIVGTYSSIFIASPFALLWEQWFGFGGRFRRRNAAPARA